MTDRSMGFLELDVASVATILVEGPDAQQVVDVCEGSGLEYEIEGDLVLTTIVRQTDDGDLVRILVDFDVTEGVVHVHSRDYLDAYGLAPIASELLEALSAAESQSLFTYSVSFAHPLVDFATLVAHLQGDGVEYVDPEAEETVTDPDLDHDAPATDPGTVDQAEPRPTSPMANEPGGPTRPHLRIEIEGDVVELYEDGYLLPVDDASASAATDLVAELNRRLVAALPDPPAAVDAAELPDGWAGPLVDRHPNLTAVVDNWATLGEGLTEREVAEIPFEADRGLADVAETILDLTLSLVYAVDHLSPSLRGRYYDRYVEDEDAPLAIALLDEGEPRDREEFVDGPLWVLETERAAAATRREIRDLDTVLASYADVDIRPGQVWRHHAPDRHAVQVVAVIGREFIGGEFVSLPVWTGEVQSVEACDHDGSGELDEDAVDPAGIDVGRAGDPDDDVGNRIVIHGEQLLEMVEE